MTRHLKPEVVTKVRGVDDGASGEPGDGKLSSVMKLYIHQAVDAQIEKWRKEGSVQSVIIYNYRIQPFFIIIITCVCLTRLFLF